MKDHYKVFLFFLLIFLAVFSIYALHPKIEGDSLLYVNSIKVLQGGPAPTGFVPMMIVSTYLGLRLIMFFAFFTHNLSWGWNILNSILYVVMGMFFYSLVKRMFKDEKIAFLSTLFLATNYAALSFGLAYMMDVGGWAAYVASLYFSYRYLEEGQSRFLAFSALAIGIGGLYKEYAFVAYAILFGLILFKNWKNWAGIFRKVLLTGLLSFGPFFLLNVYGFYTFHYTYINWLAYNTHAYTYQNRVVEFIKSFGSIYNLGWFLFIPGFYILVKQRSKEAIFIWLTILSSFAVLLWPVVTRVLFISMPAAILVSTLFIKKAEKYFYVIAFLLVLYTLCSYFMDAVILDWVRLPI